MNEYVFGMDDGRPVSCYTIENRSGMRVELISLGARIKSLFVPDKKGVLQDVALGYDTLEGYMHDKCYFGATIGRVANRIRNARFSLLGREYELAANDGPNHLHGGIAGFDKRHWDCTELLDGVSFTRHSPNGEEGYPGGLTVNVTYRLTDDNKLVIHYTACADRDTVVNLTNHCYFNLAGHDAGDIGKHELQINANFYTPGDALCVPTGEILRAGGTPMDFTSPKPIGRELLSDYPQISQYGGYDHNYILDIEKDRTGVAAIVYEPQSGRRMTVETSKPCMQLYTANATEAAGKNGVRYGKHGSFCLETQYAPDAVNRRHLAGPILRAGQMYLSTTAYGFEW